MMVQQYLDGHRFCHPALTQENKGIMGFLIGIIHPIDVAWRSKGFWSSTFWQLFIVLHSQHLVNSEVACNVSPEMICSVHSNVPGNLYVAGISWQVKAFCEQANFLGYFSSSDDQLSRAENSNGLLLYIKGLPNI